MELTKTAPSTNIHAFKFASAVQSLKEGHLDWHRSVLIEGLTNIDKSEHNGNSLRVKDEIVPIASQRPNTSRVELEFSFNKPGCAVLTDTYFSGWHAYIDNSEVPIYRANILFRAVKVEPGKHILKFKYLQILNQSGHLSHQFSHPAIVSKTNSGLPISNRNSLFIIEIYRINSMIGLAQIRVRTSCANFF